jgi:chemotaxis protein methyltransferase CheR
MSPAAVALPLADVEAALRDACGITLTDGLRSALADAFHRAAAAERLAPEAFVARLRARDARCLTALVEASVIAETYFFRHPEQFDALRALLFDVAPRDRALSIWSAGCATGEEPYSLAMALLESARAGCGDRVLATDVSARALAVAREGVYGAWSLRRLDAAVRERYFEGHPPRVSVRDEVRARVEFARHNIVADAPPAMGFDLVVCRNVLIYFERETAEAVAARLASVVAPGGLLLLGPVETPVAERLELDRLELGGATLLRRPAPVAERAPRRRAERRPDRGAGRERAALTPVPPAARTPTPALTPLPLMPELAAPVRASPDIAPGGFEAARDAARRGEIDLAERIAREVASRELCPESFLLLSMAAEARGDVAGAVDAVRRALYLDPGLAMAHAALVPLYARLGLDDDAARARRNALHAIEGMDDAAPLRGVETITAGALRSALGHAHRGRSADGTDARGDG